MGGTWKLISLFAFGCWLIWMYLRLSSSSIHVLTFQKILWYQFSLAFQTHSCSQRRNFYSIRCLPNALQMMQMRVLQINTSFFPSSRYISILQIYIQQFINLWKFFYVDENRSKFEKKMFSTPFYIFLPHYPWVSNTKEKKGNLILFSS